MKKSKENIQEEIRQSFNDYLYNFLIECRKYDISIEDIKKLVLEQVNIYFK